MSEINPDGPLNRWNIFWLTTASLTIIILFALLQFDHQHFKPASLLTLNIGLPFMLMIFQYRQLRKKKVFAAWTPIVMLLFLAFFWLRTNHSLLLKSGKSAALGLKSPLAFLIAFYAFRKIALTYYGTELILPEKYEHYSWTEGRYANFMDFFTMFSNWVIIILTGLF